MLKHPMLNQVYYGGKLRKLASVQDGVGPIAAPGRAEQFMGMVKDFIAKKPEVAYGLLGAAGGAGLGAMAAPKGKKALAAGAGAVLGGGAAYAGKKYAPEIESMGEQVLEYIKNKIGMPAGGPYLAKVPQNAVQGAGNTVSTDTLKTYGAPAKK